MNVKWLRWLLFIFSLIMSLNCRTLPQNLNNSLGMHFVLVKAGSFRMGESNPTPESLGGPEYCRAGDWDEHPVHKVRIKSAYYISSTEVTIEQYRQFRPDYEGNTEFAPYVSGVSWHDAMAFCKWLSEKEGKSYRLPTEAEWEYACRAGASSLFFSGDTLPQPETANGWGVKNMHSGVREWCLDWHAAYQEADQIDPLGPEQGIAKIVRGGGLDRNDPYYCRSANRAGIAPDFPPATLQAMQKQIAAEWGDPPKRPFVIHQPKGVKARESYPDFVRDVLGNQGNHPIGFRIVLAPMPKTSFLPFEASFVQQCVKQNNPLVNQCPDPQKPYFRKRNLLTIPPDNVADNDLDVVAATGLHPALLGHNHSPALEVCANGDVLAIYYTSISETSPDVALLATRLRFGSDVWDMPDFFLDFPDVDDHAPLLWNDKGSIWFFWGANKLKSGFPFQWMTSNDNGATWSNVRFPIFATPIGPHSAQPINTAFRDDAGTIYGASDADGAESVLWTSKDNGETWLDTGGRTGGRHTTFVLLKDGRILGMGGKSSDIDGYMPKSISSDGGTTWQIEKTPFSSLGSNQRPSVLRLASGRLFFAADMQRADGFQPKTIHQRGVCVALSDDDGQTWHIKRIPVAQEHESLERRKKLQGATLGYSAARQAPNGIIHLITSMNHPCLHFELNEAWILEPESGEAQSDSVMVSKSSADIAEMKSLVEKYHDGKVKATWNIAIAANGQAILQGSELWYYENGQAQWRVQYEQGRKIGLEEYFDHAGRKLWSWNHQKDGFSVWTHYWSNGQKKSESIWKNGRCEGIVTQSDQKGKIVRQYTLKSGELER